MTRYEKYRDLAALNPRGRKVNRNYWARLNPDCPDVVEIGWYIQRFRHKGLIPGKSWYTWENIPKEVRPFDCVLELHPNHSVFCNRCQYEAYQVDPPSGYDHLHPAERDIWGRVDTTYNNLFLHLGFSVRQDFTRQFEPGMHWYSYPHKTHTFINGPVHYDEATGILSPIWPQIERKNDRKAQHQIAKDLRQVLAQYELIQAVGGAATDEELGKTWQERRHIDAPALREAIATGFDTREKFVVFARAWICHAQQNPAKMRQLLRRSLGLTLS